MKNTKTFLLIITTTILFYNCDPNNEDLISEPVSDSQEDPVLVSNLSFNEIYAFEDNLLGGPHIGMTYSSSDNNLFISCRENEPTGYTTEEEVFKLNLDSYQLTRRNVSPGGSVTKQLTLINDTLVSIGGTEFKFFDRNFEYAGSQPYFTIPCGSSDPDCFGLNRFGIASHNNDTYIIGGAIVRPSNLTTPGDPAGDYSNPKIRILRGDVTGNFLEEFIDAPETMYRANGAVVNEKLYVFGSILENNNSVDANKIFIIPLNNPQNYEEYSMTVDASFTYVQEFGDMIIVAGRKGFNDSPKTSFVAFFDTTTNTFKEIETNLDTEGGTKAIGQMIVKENKIIILFGDRSRQGVPQSKWSILSADLLEDKKSN